jgi:hypothetical protein
MADEGFARPYDLRGGGPTAPVAYGTDDGLLVEFEVKPVLLEHLSEVGGYPRYEDRVFTRIVAPGNTKTQWYHQTKGLTVKYDEDGNFAGFEINDTANDQAEPNRFPKAWARFTKKNEKVNQGWPIEEWGAIPRSFAETLKAMNIPTVEALSILKDADAQQLMGGIKFRNLARAALDDRIANAQLAAAQAAQTKANDENEELKRRLAGMQQQIDALVKEREGKRSAA